MQDDSRFGKYECHAFAVDDPVARKHGFAVVVLRGKYLNEHPCKNFSPENFQGH